MNKYRVTFYYTASVTYEVEAPSPKDAEHAAQFNDFNPPGALYFECHDARTDDISKVEE